MESSSNIPIANAKRLALLCLGALATTCTAQAPLTGAELKSTVELLGPQQLPPDFPGLSRDGGSGGLIGGYHIVLWSDTETKVCGTITNTMSYSNVWNPKVLTEFGTNGCPRQVIPYTQAELAYTAPNPGLSRYVIWPQSKLIQLPNDSTKGFGIAPVSIQSAPGAAKPSQETYSTLYTVTATANGPTAVRTVPILWNSTTDVKYGNFGTVLGNNDGYIYFVAGEGAWGVPNSGLKLARATWATYLDKTRWQFWTNNAWVNTPPKPNTATPFIPGFFSSGDIFFSKYLGTYIAIYFSLFVDSTFRYRYVIPDASGKVSLTGTWSKEYVLKDTTSLKVNGGYGFNYAGHAYGDYDPTGKVVVLSMTLNDGITPYFLRADLTRP